jgi:hypothetical protein
MFIKLNIVKIEVQFSKGTTIQKEEKNTYHDSADFQFKFYVQSIDIGTCSK